MNIEYKRKKENYFEIFIFFQKKSVNLKEMFLTRIRILFSQGGYGSEPK